MALELKIAKRTVLGKKTRSLRKTGIIPAEIYGHGIKNSHVTVNEKDFMRLFRTAGEHTLINLVDQDSKERFPVIISHVGMNSTKGTYLSVDFHQVRMDEKIETKVPLQFIGEAPAVKNGFLVVTPLDELHIKSLPQSIPSHLDVDISKLESSGQSIYVKDILIPKGVDMLTPQDAVIVTVTEKAKEEPAPSATTTEGAPTAEASTEPSTDSQSQK